MSISYRRKSEAATARNPQSEACVYDRVREAEENDSSVSLFKYLQMDGTSKYQSLVSSVKRSYLQEAFGKKIRRTFMEQPKKFRAYGGVITTIFMHCSERC